MRSLAILTTSQSFSSRRANYPQPLTIERSFFGPDPERTRTDARRDEGFARYRGEQLHIEQSRQSSSAETIDRAWARSVCHGRPDADPRWAHRRTSSVIAPCARQQKLSHFNGHLFRNALRNYFLLAPVARTPNGVPRCHASSSNAQWRAGSKFLDSQALRKSSA